MSTQQGMARAIRTYFSARLDGCDHLLDAIEQLDSDALDPAPSAHLRECVECRTLIADWRRAPALFDVPEISAATSVRPSRPFTAAAAAAAAAALMLMVLLSLPDPPEPPLIAKGGWSLQIGVQRGEEAFRAQPGQRLRTGDHLGLFYSADRAGHLRVVYMDAERAWVELYPGPGRSDAIEPGEERRLEGGAVLTDGAGCEAVIGVFTPSPLTPSGLRETIDRLDHTPDGCPQSKGPAVQIFEVRR